MNIIMDIVRASRSFLMKALFPKSKYSMLSSKGRNLEPLSGKYGFDRGTPIDRFYIEKFLSENQNYVKGRCLEIHDDAYITKYGQDRVTVKDILDVDTSNKLANIYGDLRKLNNIAGDTYDTLIITHTIGLIDDVPAALSECYRILKPGGTLLLTASAMSPSLTGGGGFWRFTTNGFTHLMKKIFLSGNFEVKSFGNVLSGQAFWVGMAQEEMSLDELEYNDPRYSVVIAARATK